LFVSTAFNIAEVLCVSKGGGEGGWSSPRGTRSALVAMDWNIQWDMSAVLRHLDPRFVSDAALYGQMHNALSQTDTCQRDISRGKTPTPTLRTRDNMQLLSVWCMISVRKL
jgi:hypothetical protein